MSIVAGIDYKVELFDGGTWKMFVCARDANMNVGTDEIETTCPGSGNWRTFEPTVNSATLGFSGLTALNVTGFITFPELQALEFAKTIVPFRVIATSQDASTYTREFSGFITNSTDTASFDGVASFQLSVRVTGKITQVFTPPSPTTGIVYRYPAMGSTAPPTTGAYTWSTGLTGKVLLNVVKDGRGSSNIITSGTPVGNEVLYDTTTGDLTWAFPFEENETPPYMEYQNA